MRTLWLCAWPTRSTDSAAETPDQTGILDPLGDHHAIEATGELGARFIHKIAEYMKKKLQHLNA